MKKISVLFFKIILVSLILLKPVLVSGYLFKDANSNVVLELTEGEEDKSQKTSLESCDEIFHSLNFEWNGNIELLVLEKSTSVENDKEEHIREIVPPPPQALYC